MFTVQGMLIGALVGLVVTAVVAFVWPMKRLRWARPLVSAGLGALAAYAVMRLV